MQQAPCGLYFMYNEQLCSAFLTIDTKPKCFCLGKFGVFLTAGDSYATDSFDQETPLVGTETILETI